MIGAVVATVLLRGHIDCIAQVAGIMTASYSGGSVNFFAVRESFDVSENLTNPLLVADNFIMAGMFIVLLSIAGSSLFRRHFPTPHTSTEGSADATTAVADHWRAKQISLLDIALSLGIAFAIVAVAHQINGFVARSFEPSLVTSIVGNMFVLITFSSMLTATLLHRYLDRLNGAEEMGSYMLYVFLFAIGLPADLWAVLSNVPLLFLFCLIIALTNLAVTLVIGRLLRIDLEELLLCVNATLGGPPTAVAMAIAKGWHKLVVPTLLVGIWGYVIGTFLGVLIGETLMRAW